MKRYRHRDLVVRTTWLLLLLTGLLFAQGAVANATPDAPAAPTLEITKEILGGATSVPSGQSFTYRLLYRCASTTENCLGVTVTDVLPPELSGAANDVSLAGSVHTTGQSYDPNTRTATWTFIDPLPAGSTGELQLTVKFPPGVTPNGTTATNTAQMHAGNATTATSPPVTITATAAANWTLTKSVTEDGVAGGVGSYQIKICNPSGGDIGGLNINNVTLIDSLPAGSAPVDLDGGVYNSNNHTVTWNLGTLTVSGSNNCVSRSLTVSFPSPPFNVGQTVRNDAALDGTLVGGDPIHLTAFVEHTLVAPTVSVNFNKDVQGTAQFGEILNYRLELRNQGNVALDNFVIEDTVPISVAVTHIRAGDPNTPNGTFPITITYKTNLNSSWQTVPGSPFWTGPDQTVPVSALGLAANEYITALRWEYGPVPVGFEDRGSDASGFRAELLSTDRNGTPVPLGAKIENCANYTYSAPGGSTPGVDCDTTMVVNPQPKLDFSKSSNPSSAATIGVTDVNFYMNLDNNGDTPISSVAITDVIPPQLDVTVIRAGDPNTPDGTFPITITYKTNLNNSWQTVPGSPFWTGPEQTVPVSALGLAANEYITTLRWEYGDIPLGFEDKGTDGSGFLARILAVDRNGQPVSSGQVIENCADGFGLYNGARQGRTNCTTVKAYPPMPAPDVDKAVTAGSPANPGDDLTFRLKLRNTTDGTTDLINPVLADLLPVGLAYKPGSWTFSSGSLGAPTPIFEEIPNYNGTGRTLLRWRWDGASAYNLPPNGQWLQIVFQVTVAAGTAPGNHVNTGVLATHASPEITLAACADRYPDSQDLDGDGNTTEEICADDTTYTINALAALESEKLVKGQLDAAYSKYPDSGLTVPGGTADYRLKVRNPGNVAMTDLAIVDILPFVGDTGVIDLSARNSQWRPNLIGPVSAPAGVTVYYSTEGNPCRPEVVPSGPPGCSAPNWSTVPPADITTVQSLKFDFGSKVLDPLDEFTLNWPMRAPLGAPTNGEIAWNSFGYVSTRNDGGGALLPSEPFKVGIAIQPINPAAYGDFVWLDTDRDGIQDPGETGINGIRVELYRDNGDGIVDPSSDTFVGFTLTSNNGGGNPGYYLFSDLPEGDYYAKFYAAPTYDISPQNQGGDPGLDSDADPATGLTAITHLDVGEFDYTWDAGLFQPDPPVAAVGNYVWHDLDGDGVQDESAADGINGVTVRIYAASDPNNSLATTVTANDVNGNPGYYLFDNLVPGSYLLEFVLPGGATFTTRGPTGSSDPTDSDPDPNNGRTESFTLAGGQYDDAWDAGMRLPVGNLSLGDRIWKDDDNDGLYEPADGETGVDGVKLTLYRDTDGNGVYTPGVDEFVATTTSFTKAGVPGYYEFTSLIPGDYVVQVDESNFGNGGLLAGLVSSTGNEPTPDPDNDVDDDDNGDPMAGHGVVSKAITLAAGSEPAGDHNPTLDFGFYPAPQGSYVLTKSLSAAGPFRVGEAIRFTVRITNTGATTILVLPLRDTYDTNYLTFMDATPSPADLANDGTIDWPDLTSAVGDLAPGVSASVVITFVGRADTTALTDGVTINTATAYDVQQTGGAPLPDRSDTAPVQIIAPTAVLLADRALVYRSDVVEIRWTTLNESNVFGFHIYRGEQNGELVRLTQDIVPAQKPGQNSGATYEYLDNTIRPGKHYRYVLEFAGSNGPVSQMDLGQVFTGEQVFLPTVNR